MSARITNTYRMFRLFGPTTPLFCNGIPVRNVNAGITIAGNGFKENLSFFLQPLFLLCMFEFIRSPMLATRRCDVTC